LYPHDGPFLPVCEPSGRVNLPFLSMRPGHPADEIVSLPNERPNAHTGWAEKSTNGDLTMSTAMERRSSPAVLATWVDFDPGAADEIRPALTNLLADVFVLYLKTKGFLWHMSGRHFRD
jgi:hypothetical protein